MKNSEHWQPSKFERKGTQWRGSRNPQELAVSSRITSDNAVKAYQCVLTRYARGHLLDFGCGKAPLYGIYKDLTTQTTTVDWGESQHGNSHVDIVADLNKPTSLPSNEYDTLLSTSVIEHIRQPDIFFSEVSRVLKPDGIAIIATPFLYPIHEEPYDYFRFTEFALRALAENHGLVVIDIIRYGGLPEVLADLICKFLPRVMTKALQPLFTRLLIFKLIQKTSRRTAVKFPLGYVLVAQKPVNH